VPPGMDTFILPLRIASSALVIMTLPGCDWLSCEEVETCDRDSREYVQDDRRCRRVSFDLFLFHCVMSLPFCLNTP
jgi:hypothetical protein